SAPSPRTEDAMQSRLSPLLALMLALAARPAAAQAPVDLPSLGSLPLGPAALATGQDPPLADVGPSRGPIKTDRQAEGFWGTFSGKQALQETGGAAWEAPTGLRTWQSEQAWRCPVAGPLSVFGQVGASGAEAAQKDLTVTGRTGLAWQIAAPLGAVLTLRG